MLFAVEQELDESNADAARQGSRIAEALLFASSEPVDEAQLAERLPDGVGLDEVMDRLRTLYADRGVRLVRVGRKWAFRTADDLGWLLSRRTEEQRKLSKPAMETLAIIAYHQPATRVEIEEIRGVALSKGILDLLLETGWVRLRGRRRAPGRPVTYGTTEAFLLHFGLEQIADLPGLDELKATGLFEGRLPQEFQIPRPSDDPALREDEDPLEDPILPLDPPDEAQEVEATMQEAAPESERTEESGPEDAELWSGAD